MKNYSQYFETNKKLWDSKTPIHIQSKFYDMEAFNNGSNSLRKIELGELPDLSGKNILHTQCHFGQDTLSMERMGARTTGVDLSPVAISSAEKIRDELNLTARFITCNIYDLDQHLNEDFDMVFTSYGVIAWLPDLYLWADQICKRLKKGGVFYMAEFHPVLYMFDWDKQKIAYEYFNNGEAQMEINQGTYVDGDADIILKEYFWQHSLSEVLNALVSNGLEIVNFNEYEYSPYDCFPNMAKRADQEYVFTHNGVNIPHVFSLTCIKK